MNIMEGGNELSNEDMNQHKRIISCLLTTHGLECLYPHCPDSAVCKGVSKEFVALALKNLLEKNDQTIF